LARRCAGVAQPVQRPHVLLGEASHVSGTRNMCASTTASEVSFAATEPSP
jgi:hypothetical protein